MATEGIQGLAERPAGQPIKIVPVMRPFEEQHWQALEMLVADPDGRELSVQAPLPGPMDDGE